MTDSDNPIVAKASLERRFVATAAALEQHGSTFESSSSGRARRGARWRRS